MRRKLMIVCVVLGLGLIQMLEAQVVTTAVPFLMITPNARAGGLGDAGVALGDDAWATYWNPAGYAFQKGTDLAINHANWLPAFNLGDVWIAHAVYKQPVEQLDGVMSLGVTYLNLGEFARTDIDPTVLETFKGYEVAFTAGYATKLSENVGIGLNVRLIHSALSPFGTAQEQGKGVATGFSFDIGMLYKPRAVVIPLVDLDLGDKLSLGFNLSNIGPKITYIDKAQADPIPLNLRLGFGYKILESEFNNLTVLMDFNRLLVHTTDKGTDEFYQAIFTTWTGKNISEQLRQFVTNIGMEYWYGSPKLFALRVGYFYEDPQSGNRKYMTFGGGVRVDMYGFDFSYISTFEEQHPLGETLRFSLQISWGAIVP